MDASGDTFVDVGKHLPGTSKSDAIRSVNGGSRNVGTTKTLLAQDYCSYLIIQHDLYQCLERLPRFFLLLFSGWYNYSYPARLRLLRCRCK